jgi:hypothetical protein
MEQLASAPPPDGSFGALLRAARLRPGDHVADQPGVQTVLIVHCAQVAGFEPAPLRPELAALLGVCPSLQVARCAGGRDCWPL